MAYPAVAQERCIIEELVQAIQAADKVELKSDECVAYPQTAPNVEEIAGDLVNHVYHDLMKELAKV